MERGKSPSAVLTGVRSTVRVRVGCEFAYSCAAATPALTMFEPRPGGERRILEHGLAVEPDVESSLYVDLYGNRVRRLTLPPGDVVLVYRALVEAPAEPAPSDVSARQHSAGDLPAETLLYVLPSRFCPSDELYDAAWERFRDVPPGWQTVQAICDEVHTALKFDYFSASPAQTALGALALGRGVCRDYAHLAITYCRALNIPARYVFGYLPDIGVPPPDAPMDFCAWFEAYLGDRWWTFDPRNNQRRIANIPIGRGRDAVDVPMVTTFGAAQLQRMTVTAEQCI